jgi:hypothetical protein
VRGIAAIVICVLGGCAREKALLVEVETDDKTSNVELLLVQQPCPDCDDGMGLPGAIKKTPGTVFYTDGDARVYAPVDPTAKRARFWIEPGTDGHLLRIVAVGFDIQDQPKSLMDVPDLNVADHLGERFDVTLAPHAIGRPPAIANVDPIADQDTVMLWRPPASTVATTTDHASCMMVTHASDHQTEFLVPPIDSDCDTVIEGECDRTWYRHAVTPDPTKICLDTTGRNNACRIGNPSSCVDGIGQACATGSTCIPDDACTICSRLDSTCVDNLFNPGLLTVPRLECSVPVNTNGVPPYPLCSSGAAVDGTAFAGLGAPSDTFVPYTKCAVTFEGSTTHVEVAYDQWNGGENCPVFDNAGGGMP